MLNGRERLRVLLSDRHDASLLNKTQNEPRDLPLLELHVQGLEVGAPEWLVQLEASMEGS